MMSIGQYVHLDSLIHKLDPRTKLLGLTLLGILTFLARDYPQILILFVFFALIVLLSKLPLIHILKGLKGFLFLFVFTILVHSFFTPGEEAFLGLSKGLFIVLQIALLILGAMLLSWTTSPLQLVDGLRRLFAPARFIGVPVDKLCLIVVIAARFIPTLILEADRLIKAQKSRGIEFKTGPLRRRAKNSISIVAPLFINALRRAETLALSMEVRCFRGMEGRTQLRELRFNRGDFAALLALAGLAFFIP